ncbi:MAG: hypothetical protein V4795_16985 [Pseudomonadota bacterium]
MFTSQLDPRAEQQRRMRAAPPSKTASRDLPRGPLGAGRRLARTGCACGGGCPGCASQAGATGSRSARDGGDAADVVAPAQDAAPTQAADPVPAFRDCSERITGIPDANQRLETARGRAREFVGAARRALAAAPTAGTVYDTALGRHFIAPGAAERTTIAASYGQILNTLVPGNYICNSNNICGSEQAFWIEADDLVHVCRPFWELSPTCRAIILIHEGAHDVGFGIAGAHPPNRGSADYPAGDVAAPAGQTTALRMDNPDAYAFFAAHIWRDTDTSRTCF